MTKSKSKPTRIDGKQKFPWRRLFRLAMAQGISPDVVWAMTPAEVLAGLEPARTQDEAVAGDDILAALMRRHAGSKTVPNGLDGAQ